MRRRLVEREVCLRFAAELYRHQLAHGRHFLHEHPARASSWKRPCIDRLMKDPRVSSVLADQCQYGLVTTHASGQTRAIRKTTRFMSSAPLVLEELSLRCQGGHVHDRMEGGRTASAAAIYSPALCRAILRGAERQRLADGRPVPSGVHQLQSVGLGVLALQNRSPAKPAPDARGASPLARELVGAGLVEEQYLEVDEGVLDTEIGDEEENLALYGVPDGQAQWLRFFGGPMWRSAYLAQTNPLPCRPALGGASPSRSRRQEELLRRAARPAVPPGPVYDEYTGDLLPSSLVAQAREEEVGVMEE